MVTLMLYLDPGTGSLLLQSLAAAFLAAGLFWRRIHDAWRKFYFKAFPKRSK